MTALDQRETAVSLLLTREGLRTALPVLLTAVAFWAGWVVA